MLIPTSSSVSNTTQRLAGQRLKYCLSLVMIFVINLIIFVTFCQASPYHNGGENGVNYSGEWIVRLDNTDEEVAQLLALELGYFYGGKVPNFPDTHIFYRNDHEIGRRNGNPEKTKAISDHPKVTWAEQLFEKKRQKRDLINFDVEDPKGSFFNDELWSQEWYLHDTRTRGDLPKLDLNVLPLYKLGYTGKDVKVSILDDGIEYLHDDLKDNYEPSISWDCNENDDDPIPNYDEERKNAHGTRCAGEIAMKANNFKCGVGIAYEAKIGGIKLLDGIVNDKIEGAALGFGYDKIDIYSASWGPNDDGKTVEGPGRLAQEALHRGIARGRDGKGVIFVWANGNGGSRNDNCNCDGYTGSIYTISVGSASQRGEFPWYGEQCASTMAVTYSSGAYHDQMITTTDLNNECTIRHTGTSASAPLAAGIIALALQANKELTWRDVQHLIVWTSDASPLSDDIGWQTNGGGLKFNERFGYGLMNAYKMVTSAHNWTAVPPKSICEVKSTHNISREFKYGQSYIVEMKTNGCQYTKDEVNYLEHVQLQTNLVYPIRGSIQIYLTSPSGTRVSLLNPRKLDDSNKGFVEWRFMSVATWSEAPGGTWTVHFEDTTGPIDNIGKVGPLTLIMHGTKERPNHVKQNTWKNDHQIHTSDNYNNNNLEDYSYDYYAKYQNNLDSLWEKIKAMFSDGENHETDQDLEALSLETLNRVHHQNGI